MAEQTVQSLRDRVDATIAAGTEKIHDAVVASFVDAELDQRAKLIVSGIATLREIEADIRKINRADQVLFNSDGTPGQALYSKDRVNQIKKGKDRLMKLQLLLDKVVQSNDAADYKNLQDGIKKAKSSDNNATSSEDDE